MSDPNSGVELMCRPADLMEELSIKKDAYYAYVNFLGIKAEKDGDGKAYLNPAQANEIRALRSHVGITGKMEGFQSSDGSAGELTIGGSSSLLENAEAINDEAFTGDPSGLVRAAMELKATQLVKPELVVREMAAMLTYEELDPDIREKVESVRESTSPKFQPKSIAVELLNRWRNGRTA